MRKHRRLLNGVFVKMRKTENLDSSFERYASPRRRNQNASESASRRVFSIKCEACVRKAKQ